jgi:hypothetical protein
MKLAGLVAWTVALAIATAGCSSADRKRDDAATGSAGTSGATAAAAADANDPATMTVTGCLQKGDDQSDFVLTHVSSQPQPTASRGGNESTAVQEKPQQPPARAYRLSGGPDDLRDWVGHQVRVTGKLEDRGGVQSPDSNRPVKEGELAKLEVTSAESIGDTCGASRY